MLRYTNTVCRITLKLITDSLHKRQFCCSNIFFHKRLSHIFVESNVIELKMNLLHTSCLRQTNDQEKIEKKALVVRKQVFEGMQNKNKGTFVKAVEIFEDQGKERRGHVEFIYAAITYMKEFGVHKDLEAYKKLMDVFPKGKFIATNMFQVEFMHYPKQQMCAVDLLEEMESNGVMPDREMHDILMNVFGSWSFPMRKFKRMMYWMPKFKNLSPWSLPNPAPVDPFELAKLAITRMCSVDLQTEISVFETETLNDSIDHTWIVSGQSRKQQELLENVSDKTPVFVEGPFQIFIREHMVNYFFLRIDSKPRPQRRTKESLDDVSDIPLWMYGEENKFSEMAVVLSVHEQEESTILGLCASGTSSRDSLLSWIRFLQVKNPQLTKVPVVFSLRAPPSTTDIVPANIPNECESGISKNVKQKKESDDDKR